MLNFVRNRNHRDKENEIHFVFQLNRPQKIEQRAIDSIIKIE
jgi:hypothetical protein